jgi:hypothetical protein
MIAVSMDGREMLATVPAVGLGQISVYPKPSVMTYIQSDEQGMWGRNCARCKKYFRTAHVGGLTFCPYCSTPDDGLAFTSKDQRAYITAYYDAFMRAYIGKQSSVLDMADITDDVPAWHYSEEKLQSHFECDTKDCKAQTDILGEYGYCPRCGKTNARKLFPERMRRMLERLETIKGTTLDRHEREENWEKMLISSLSELEAVAKHLRAKLLLFPLTANRRKRLESSKRTLICGNGSTSDCWSGTGPLQRHVVRFRSLTYRSLKR